MEFLERREMLTSYWQNPVRTLDVNNDAFLSPIDALLIINRLNDPSLEGSLGQRENSLDSYFDTSGDAFCSPTDALLVINALNSENSDELYLHAPTINGQYPAPAGFVSRTLVKIPGEPGELMGLTVRVDATERDFHELGVFPVDDLDGNIKGVQANQQEYPFTAFSTPEKQVLFSRYDVSRSVNSAVFAGGQWVAVYALQATSSASSPLDHLDFEFSSNEEISITWQELKSTATPVLAPFQDSKLSASISPINRNPVVESTPVSLIGDTSNYFYQVVASDVDGDSLSYQLLAAPHAMTVDSATGFISWPASATTVGNHYVELEVVDGNGGFRRQAFTLEVVESLPNRPPVVLSQPRLSHQVEPDSVFYAANTLTFEDWETVQFGDAENYPAQWSLSRNGQRAIQSLEAIPSFLLSPTSLADMRFEGLVENNYYFGGGRNGLVFGFEDSQHFYLFDWKQYDDGIALEGMSIKRFSADRPLTDQDFHPTEVDSEVGELLYHNSIGFDRTQYTLSLEQFESGIHLVVSTPETTLADIELQIPDLPAGRVGFFNAFGVSLFADFSVKQLGGDGYRYQIEAYDADSDELQYQLIDGPRDSRITSTGEIVWQPTYQDVGSHNFSVLVSDGQGGMVEHTFVVCVVPGKENGTPEIVSVPITDHNHGNYVYAVEAIDPEDDVLTFELLEAPPGMRIDQNTGLIQWDEQDFSDAGIDFYDVPRAFYAGAGARTPITVAVQDPSGNRSTQSFDLYVYVSPPSTLTGYVFEDLNRNGQLDTALVQGDIPYFVFVVDPSNSMAEPFKGQSVGDPDLDGYADTLWDASLYSVSLLIEHLVEDLGLVDAQIGLVSLYEAMDMDPALEGHQSFIGVTEDRDNDGVRDVIQVLTRVYFGGISSPFDVGLQYAIDAFEELNSSSDKTLLFFSDGFHGGLGAGDFEDEVATLNQMDVNLQAFAMSGSSTAALESIDSDPLVVHYTGDLLQAFDGRNPTSFQITEPTLSDWTVFLDIDNNGQLDPSEPISITNSLGQYQFDDLNAGRYVIRTLPKPGWSPTAPQSGSFTTILIGGESQILSHFGFISNQSGASDDPPIFVSSPANSVEIGDVFTYDALAMDPNGFPVSYSLTVGPANATIHPTLGRLLWSPTIHDVGPRNFIVTATDTSGVQTQQRFAVNVKSSPTPLTLVSTPPEYWPIGVQTSYQLQVSNAPAGLSYSVLAGPANLSVSSDGIVQWTPDDSYSGIVIADGPFGYWKFDEPTGSTVLADSSGNSYHAISSDPIISVANTPADGTAITTSGYITVPTGTNIPLTEATLEAWVRSVPEGNNTWIASLDNNGGFDLFQGSFLSHGLSFTGNGIELEEPLDIWHHVVGTYSLSNGRKLYIDGDLVAETGPVQLDPDGLYSIGLSYGWAGELDEVAMYNYPLSPDQIQSHYLHRIQPVRPAVIQILGPNGESLVHEFMLTVRGGAENSPPKILNSMPASVGVGSPLTYQIDAADDAGMIANYSLLNTPVGMTIDEAGVVRWTPSQAQLGAHQFQVRVADNEGAFETQSVTIEVISQLTSDQLRIVSLPGSHAVVNSAYEYQAITNSARSTLWTLENAPAGMTIDARTGRVRWTPNSSAVGQSEIVILANVEGVLARQQFFIDVSCVNVAPRITSTPSTRSFVQHDYRYSAIAFDPDHDPLTWQLLSSPEGMSIDQQGVVTWPSNLVEIGQHLVEISVSDGVSTATQRFRIEILDLATTNRPPEIVSSPVYSAQTGIAYSYAIQALDPDGDSVVLSAAGSLPDGMTFTAPNVLNWIPRPDQVASHVVSISATDSRGGTSTQIFIVDVQNNLNPIVTSTPPDQGVRGSEYRYLIKAYDPEGSSLTYKILNGPAGLSVDKAGGVRWPIPLHAAETNPVAVLITDSSGRSTTHQWSIATQADSTVPVAGLLVDVGGKRILPGESIDIGAQIRLRATGVDNAGISSLSLAVNGQILLLDSANIAYWLAQQLGPLDVSVMATDTAGLVNTYMTTFTVVDPAVRNSPIPNDPTLPPHPGFDPTDTGIPTIEITSPEGAATVSNLVPIIGTVDDPEDNLWFYRVYIARADRVDIAALDLDDPDWQLIKTSTEEVIDGELAVFDTTLVSNDPYTIAVAAFDVNGLGYIQPTMVYVEGNVDVGNFNITITDLTIPLAGIPIQVSRTYDTHHAADLGDFGYGWTLAISDPRIFEATAVGAGGAFNPGNDKFVPGRTKVYLTNPAGQRVGFTYQERYLVGGLFGAAFQPYFEPDPGVYDQLLTDETQVFRGIIAGDFGQGINPSAYTLVTKEGMRYRYDDVAGLESIEDRHGNIVSITARGMTHSSGQSIRFVRDQQGRIVSLIDPDGRSVDYSYDALGDLRSVTDQIGLQTQYSYRSDIPHYLDEATNALGNRVFEVQYDSNRKYVGIVDALGNLSQQDFHVNQNYGVVRDALGHATTIYYDDRGNVLREVDPIGHETIREYADPNNPDLETRIVDRNGYVSLRSYDALGNLLTMVEAGTVNSPLTIPVVTSFLYTVDNQVEAITNAAGQTTSFRYDDSGLLVKMTNALGDSSSFTYDQAGRRSSFTDFNGNTTQFEYDNACPCGSPSKVIYADGAYQTYAYNKLGQVTEEASFERDGTLAEIKQTDFDDIGRIVEERFGLPGDPQQPQTVVRKFYQGHLLDWEVIIHPDSLDAQGNLLESPATPVAQRKSRITQYFYDAADQLIRQIDAAGGVVEFRYDAGGNRVLLQDPVGNITTWVYDQLGRISEERDPFYNEGLTIEQAMAALSVPSGVNLGADTGAAHVRAFAYDGEGNQVESIDRNGRRREFEYDGQGRLLTERWYAADTNALIETISFSYDALGNMLTASDSNSNYLYTYDVLNRLTSVDNNPDGSMDVPRVILSYGYDAQGNTILTQDDAGVTVASTYDARNRLDVRLWYDATIGVGEVAEVDPVRVEFDYNAANRESEVRRFSGLDASQMVGRTWRTYDTAGRSDLLNHVNAVDELLAGYDYDYDFAGLVIHENRPHQTAEYAQEVDYRYDLTGQLVDAWFTGQDDEHFQYDPNGNRISSSLGDETRTYTTGVANQLRSDGIYRYEYDGEGNQVKRVHLTTGETRTMEYDHHNRLVSVDDWSSDPGDPNDPVASSIVLQTVEYIYDANGRRIARFLDRDGAGSQLGESELFVYNDDNLWANKDTSYFTSSRYLWGDTVDSIQIRFHRDQGAVIYLHDQLRTSRDIQVGDTLYHFSTETFGVVMTRSSGTDDFFYAGQENERSTGLYFLRSRYLDSNTGRFTSVDTIGFRGLDSNTYRYALNSPTLGRDPFGTTTYIEAASAARVALIGTGLGIAAGLYGGQALISYCEGSQYFDVTTLKVQTIDYSKPMEAMILTGSIIGGIGLGAISSFATLGLLVGSAEAFAITSFAGTVGLAFAGTLPPELAPAVGSLGCVALDKLDHILFDWWYAGK